MAEKPEEDFDDDSDDAVDGSEAADYDTLLRDLDTQKRKGRGHSHAAGEPAWRKLERFLEDRRAKELLSDFEDYEVGDERPRKIKRKPRMRNDD